MLFIKDPMEKVVACDYLITLVITEILLNRKYCLCQNPYDIIDNQSQLEVVTNRNTLLTSGEFLAVKWD